MTTSLELENAEIYAEFEDEKNILIRMKITPASRWSIYIGGGVYTEENLFGLYLPYKQI